VCKRNKTLNRNLKLQNFDNKNIILGIDPGTTIMEFGLIKEVINKKEILQLNELVLSKMR
jgi:hypothetical protein